MKRKKILKLIVKIILYPAFSVYMAFRHKHHSIIEAHKKELSKLVTKFCKKSIYNEKDGPYIINVQHVRASIYTVSVQRPLHHVKHMAKWEKDFSFPYTSHYDICQDVREGLIQLHNLKPKKGMKRV